MNKRYIEILTRIVSCPTAPFAEHAVVREIAAFAAEIGLQVECDRFGNVLLNYRRGKRLGAKWVFAAHMDHPGFVVVPAAGDRPSRKVMAEFRGGVREEYFVGARVRLILGDAGVRATVKKFTPAAENQFSLCELELARPMHVPGGTIGMWDFAPARIAGGRLIARACDDIAGVASVLAAMDEIVSRRLNANVTALFTRAEEVGFVGALAVCESGILDRDSLIVAIETSAAQPSAPLGSGAIVRVGDRARTFDPSLTACVASVAGDLAKSDKTFRHTRQLMPGGTCESTAFCAFGYQATGLCVPLANYHNMGKGKMANGKGRRVAPEQIDLGDFQSLVKLLAGLAASNATPAQADKKLLDALKARLKARRHYLLRTKQPCANGTLAPHYDF
jgi:endoglucanase